MNHFYKRFLLPTSLLAGAIIGAGVFSLPYLFREVGLATGLGYLLIGGALYAFLHLLYADTILRTPGEHRFMGYARIYLGRPGARLALLMTVVGMIFVLTIYLVLSVSFANLLFEGSPFLKLAIFWLVASTGIFLNIRKLVFSEFVVTFAKLLIILLLSVLGIRAFFEKGVLAASPADLKTLFLPLAPVLFAMSGRVAIPSLVKYFRFLHDGRDYPAMRRAIEWGTLVPIGVYALFAVAVIGLSPVVSEDAIGGLRFALSPHLLQLLGGLGLLSLWGSYIAIGSDTLASFSKDIRLSRSVGALIVVGSPLVLYLSGFTSFLSLVGFVGGIFLGLEGIFILLMWMRARKAEGPRLISPAHPFAISAAFVLLISAIIYEVTHYFL